MVRQAHHERALVSVCPERVEGRVPLAWFDRLTHPRLARGGGHPGGGAGVSPATNPFPTPALCPYPLSMSAICKLPPLSVRPAPVPSPDGNRRHPFALSPAEGACPEHRRRRFVSPFFANLRTILALLVDITSETNTPCSVPSGTLPNLKRSALLLSEYRRGNLGWLCRGGWKHA